jgi:hypothetical protein
VSEISNCIGMPIMFKSFAGKDEKEAGKPDSSM